MESHPRSPDSGDSLTVTEAGVKAGLALPGHQSGLAGGGDSGGVRSQDLDFVQPDWSLHTWQQQHGVNNNTHTDDDDDLPGLDNILDCNFPAW